MFKNLPLFAWATIRKTTATRQRRRRRRRLWWQRQTNTRATAATVRYTDTFAAVDFGQFAVLRHMRQLLLLLLWAREPERMREWESFCFCVCEWLANWTKCECKREIMLLGNFYFGRAFELWEIHVLFLAIDNSCW